MRIFERIPYRAARFDYCLSWTQSTWYSTSNDDDLYGCSILAGLQSQKLPVSIFHNFMNTRSFREEAESSDWFGFE